MNVRTTQKEVIKLSLFIVRKFVLKPVSVWLCFQDNRNRVLGTRALFAGSVSATTRYEGLVPQYGMCL